MQVTREKIGDRLVLRADGRFDNAGAKTVADALDQALAGGSHTVEIDMAGVSYLSSAGIRVLIAYHQKFSRLKGGLYLTSVSERISQLLEMTGLYDLLDSPEEDSGSATSLQARSYEGWSLASRSLEPEGRFVPRTIGRTIPNAAGQLDESSPEILPFSPDILALGNGALGFDTVECRGRYGPFLAAAGYATYRPLTGEEPDFEEYAEAYIPRLHVISGIAMTGSFALQVSFESDASPPGFPDLAASFLTLCNTPACALVIAAECEVPQGILGSPLHPAGHAGDGEGVMTAADGSRLCLVLAGGTFGSDAVHVQAHAAFFSYQPLRRHGRVTLKDTAGSLFEQDLLDVLPITIPPGKSAGPEIRLLRGLAWVAPLESSP